MLKDAVTLAENDKDNMDGAMTKLLDKLIAVIAEEANVFEVFLVLLRQQHKALIENNSQEVSRVTSELQGIVERSKRLENERAGTVDQIRQSEGIANNLTVAEICDMADEQRSIQLNNLRETILELYSRIEEMRARNGMLVEQSLEQIHHTMEMIGNISSEQKTYGKEGALMKASASLGLDRRV